MLKFLVPVDGSEPCSETIKQLRKYLGWIKDEVEIHLLNVQPHLPFGKRASEVLGREAVAHYHEENGMAALKPARKLLDEAKFPYQHSIVIGEPAEAIADYAKQKGCDQIIMGTRGMGTVAGLVLGSVATKVIQLSPVPVLLMKKRAPAARKS